MDRSEVQSEAEPASAVSPPITTTTAPDADDANTTNIGAESECQTAEDNPINDQPNEEAKQNLHSERSRLPHRRRNVPSKFRDYEYADVVLKEEETSDHSYDPKASSTFFSLSSSSGRPRGRPRKNGRDHTYQIRQGSNTDHLTGDKSDEQMQTDSDAASSDPSRCHPRLRISPYDEGMLKRPRTHRCLKPDCGQTFLRLSTLLKHTATMHSDSGEPRVGRPAAPTGENSATLRPFKCLVCGKSFSQKNNLRVHASLHSGDKPYVCDESDCKQRFRTAESLKNHKRRHLGIKPFQCQMCDTRCTSNQALKEHMMRHTDAKPYVCAICQRSFRQVSCYSRHLTTHTDVKPFPCSVCGKRFSQLAYVRSHLKSHTGEKPFSCSECGKRFAHQSDKKRHEVIHTGKKPYTCEMCGVKFNDASSCRRHVREHATASLFECQLCGEAFRRPTQLKSHVNKHHNNGRKAEAMVDGEKAIVLQTVGDEYSTGGNSADIHQHIMQEIGRKLNGIQGPVAYHILHEDEMQQVVEIHYNMPQSSEQSQQVSAVEAGDESHIPGPLSDEAEQHQHMDADGGSVSYGQQVLDNQSIQHQQLEPGREEVSEVKTESHRETLIFDKAETAIHPDTYNQTLIQTVATERDVANGEMIAATSNSQPTLFVQCLDSSVLENVTESKHGITNKHKHESMKNDHHQLVCEKQDSSLSPQQPVSQHHNTHTVNSSNSPQDAVGSDSVAPVSSGEFMVVQSTMAMQSELSNGGYFLENEIDTQEAYSIQELAPEETEQMEGTEDVACAINVEEGLTILQANTGLDYVNQPDFNSQHYYNWLSSFCELVKLLQMPIELELFQKISRVHKTLADVLANPSGVLQDKSNFKILMSLSADLNSIINSHLQHVLMTLDT